MIASLDERGFAVVPRFLDPATCASLIASFDEAATFRKTVVMAPVGFGRGTYRYYAYPLPPVVAAARERAYAFLADTANRWAAELGRSERYPPTLDAMLERCHAAGQRRPTPLLLRYTAGDWNALHQDVYGEIAFPLQAAVLLSEPGRDFTGGEFTLVEAKPRKQSAPHVVPLGLGDAVLFPNTHKPNARGGRSTFRHGVSEVRSGTRFTLGLILHDAT